MEVRRRYDRTAIRARPRRYKWNRPVPRNGVAAIERMFLSEEWPVGHLLAVARISITAVGGDDLAVVVAVCLRPTPIFASCACLAHARCPSLRDLVPRLARVY